MSLSESVVIRALDYRDAIMHGYVFPISGKETGLYLKVEPKMEGFSFHGLMTDTIQSFCESSYITVTDFIGKGWRCFEADELT